MGETAREAEEIEVEGKGGRTISIERVELKPRVRNIFLPELPCTRQRDV